MAENIDAVMAAIPSDVRWHWCEAQTNEMGCACMGCVQTCTGGKVTRAEFVSWIAKNPPPSKHERTILHYGEMKNQHLVNLARGLADELDMIGYSESAIVRELAKRMEPKKNVG